METEKKEPEFLCVEGKGETGVVIFLTLAIAAASADDKKAALQALKNAAMMAARAEIPPERTRALMDEARVLYAKGPLNFLRFLKGHGTTQVTAEEAKAMTLHGMANDPFDHVAGMMATAPRNMLN